MRGGREAGATVVVMESHELCRLASDPQDYASVYCRVLVELEPPAILHWLGEAFDPALSGYWGAPDFEAASRSLLTIVQACRDKVDGVKLSVLEQDKKEVELRRQLPPGVRLYTGDDFAYPSAIAGDEDGHSDALLGAFDFAAPAAAFALEALDAGDTTELHRRLDPTLALSPHVFCAPTQLYKTGVVFLAYLNGFQSHFKMVGGLESGRSIVHLATCFALADQAGLLLDAELATDRMTHVLALAGIEARARPERSPEMPSEDQGGKLFRPVHIERPESPVSFRLLPPARSTAPFVTSRWSACRYVGDLPPAARGTGRRRTSVGASTLRGAGCAAGPSGSLEQALGSRARR